MTKDALLRTTIACIARENENEAMIAMRQATRMLATRGLTWSNVADLVISAANDNRGAARPAEARAEASPRPEPQPRPRGETLNVRGHNIPATLRGTIEIVKRERTRSRGERIIFIVIDQTRDMVFGPMVGYRRDVASKLERADGSGGLVDVTMLSTGEGWHPQDGRPFMPQAGEVRFHR